MSGPDVTVAIPLHASARWASNVAVNVARLRSHVRLVISDATEHDDTLQRLQCEFGSAPGIEWLGRRDLEPGYVPHYNDLLRRVSTPYFMWLPADDEIDADYIDKCAQSLRDDRDLVMCVGSIEAVAGERMCEPEFSLMPHEGGSSSALTRIETLVLDWQPWILFRSVFRVSSLNLIRDTDEGASADALWILGLLGRGPARQVPEAVYRKRFYSESTHVGMRTLSPRERAVWAYREVAPVVGRADTLRLLLSVGSQRGMRRITGGGRGQVRRPAPCGHIFCG